MDVEPLNISVVFTALSRPTTFMGVDYDYFLVESMAIMFVFIYSGNLLALLLYLPFQLMGWILVKIDPDIFRLLSVKATIGSIKNKSIWNCQSYEAY